MKSLKYIVASYMETFLNTCLIILFTEFVINVVILLNYSEMTVP